MMVFPSSIRIPVRNHLTGRTCYLVRGDEVSRTNECLSGIVAICNEPAIYKGLFARLLAGQPYTMNMAVEWLAWAEEGWRNNTRFCFMTLDVRGDVVAACDIKSAEVDGAEVGYWTSSSHRGVMTNTVATVIQLAANAGFRSLMARAQHANFRSKRVMERVGFLPDPARRDESHDYFLLSLLP